MVANAWSFALVLLALACSGLSLWITVRRSPTAVARELLAKWETEAALVSATRERWTAEFAGIAERCDEILDRAESKRRRVAAVESRRQPEAAEEMTREQVIETARRRTLGAH